MKKLLFAISAVALLFATSCNKDNSLDDIVLGDNEFLATIDNGAVPQNAPRISDGMTTKTTIDNQNYISWQTDDEIYINGFVYTASGSGNNVVFNGTGATGNDFKAFYAIDASQDISGASASLPAAQTFNPANVSNLPMYATGGADHKLTFHNICAVLKIEIPSFVNGATRIEVSSEQRMNGAFTVTSNTAVMAPSSSDADKKITVTKEGGNFATGDVVYIAVPAATYTTLKIEFFNGATSMWDKTIAHTLEVNKIYPVTMSIMPPASNCFCFTALEDGCTVSFEASNYLQYYKSGDADWTAYSSGTTITLTNTGDKVYFKAKSGGNSSLGEKCFELGGQMKVGGNIMYLLDPTGQSTSIGSKAFRRLFMNCTTLVDAGDLILPAMTLDTKCYQNMFSSCESLINAPTISATTMGYYSCSYMFSSCTALVNAPALPATTLDEYCYQCMFDGCSSLVNAPALPAASMEKCCYEQMFLNCVSLVTAPALQSTQLAGGCYNGMFAGCTTLVNAPSLPAATMKGNCYATMFSKCSALVNAPALTSTNLADNCYEQMFRECTSLVTAPELPATTLSENCYKIMFKDCSKLSTVTMKATNIPANSCLLNWLEDAGTNVPSGTTPTLYVDPSMTNNAIIVNSKGNFTIDEISSN